MSRRRTDDELLDLLGESLGPVPHAEPTWAEVSALHRVIDSAAVQDRRGVRLPVWRARRRLAAVAAGVTLLAGGSAAAALTGDGLPRPVRVAARAVGLPVESPALADARTALADLAHALHASPRDLAHVRSSADVVRARLAALSADDRAHVEDEAAFLLAEADAALSPPPPLISATGSKPGPAAAPAPSAGASSTPQVTQPVDDHGGRTQSPATTVGTVPRADDGASPSSGPGPSGDGSTATTIRTDNSGPGSISSGSDDGSSHDGSSGSGSDGGGGHSGPG